MINKIINDFKILNKINDGSFGTVYKAVRNDGFVCAVKHVFISSKNENINKLIKKKIVKTEEEAFKYLIDKINNEVEIMKKFNGNPYVVDCYGTYQENRLDGSGIDCFILMEFVEDIKTYYGKGLIDLDEVVKLGIDICSSLELCFSIGIIHNDIKPENMFVGNDGVYKLGDFGASFNVNDVGNLATLNYVSPEVYKGKKASSNSDLYSLGLIMYQMVNGKLPFVTKNVLEKDAFEYRMSGRELPVIKGLNKKLMDIILKACAYNENDRYKDASEMKKDLESLSHINSKKIKVIFSSDQDYVDTVDINDEKLLDASKNINFDSMDVSSKFDIKSIIAFLVIAVIVLLLLFISSLNKECESGFINKGGKCVRGYYYCENGYSLNSDNRCQKTIESIDAKVSFECPSNYTLNGDVCVSNEVKEPTFVYKCADGFKLNGTKCERVESLDAILTYSCPGGYVVAGDQCVTISNIDATLKYECSAGGTLNGTACDYRIEPDYEYGFVPKCSKGTYDYKERICKYTNDAKKVYECPSGYLVVGNQCSKQSNIAGTPKYTCPDGSSLKNGKCYKTVTTDATGMYECPNGYIASGVTCVEENLPAPTKKYSCSRVYTLNGDKCEKYEIIMSKEYYYDN